MRILAIALTCLVLLLGAALIGPSFVDWNKYKDQITGQVKAASGYDVRINGDLSLAVLPSPRVTIRDAVIAAPNPVKEQTLISVEEARVSVALFPLLSKRVEVQDIRLVKPDIRLEVNQQGGQSWMVQKVSEGAEVAAEIAGAAAEAASDEINGAMKAISLDSVKIEEGRIHFVNYQTGASQLVENFNVNLKADSVYGPYDAKGDVVYGGNKITYEAKTSAIDAGDDVTVNAKIGLPDKNASVTFDGVAGKVAPFNTQGEIRVTLDKLESLAAVPAPLQGKTTLHGMITANEEKASIRDAAFQIGKMKGKGALDVAGIKDRNPLGVTGRFDLESGVNIDDLMKKSGSSAPSKTESKSAQNTKSDTPVPVSLSFPFPLTLDVSLNAPEMTMNGQSLKGVTLTAAKQGATMAVALKANDIPGGGNIDAKGQLRYAASSANSGGGITYSDPDLSFSAVGRANQLPTLLRAALPDQRNNAALEAFKTADFNIKGGLDGSRISLTDSRITLDDTALAVGGSYQPVTGGKPNVALDLSAGYLNLDDLMTRLQGDKKQAVQKPANQPKDMKAALDPVRNFELPVNLTFDISLQKARYNGMDASGIRLKGKSVGDALTLETASAQSLLGATLSAKGQVASLKNLSGIDIDFYGKTDNVKAVMTALKQDTSNLPAQLSAAEVTANAKGTADALAFNANAKALSGSLDASGNAKGLLGTPSFDNITVRLKHPNFVQAMQIMNPQFSGGPGMAKPVDFYAKLVNEGKVYTLNDFKASLGTTTASGDMRFDNSGAKPAINGTLVLGDLPLDDLLGAKASGGASGGAGASTASNASAGGERWSRQAFDTGWMHSANMNLTVSAKSITYGGWNFQNPKTGVTLNNGSLAVKDLTGGLFGGSAKLNASAQSSADQKQPVSLSVDSAMQNVNLQQLAGALSNSNRIKASGTGSLTFDVAGTGVSPNALVSSLKGKANLDADNVVFQGFDLAQLAMALLDSGKPLDRLQSAVGGATSSGQTRFDTITGRYNINEGVVAIGSMQMKGPSATIDSTGNVSLPRWFIDTVHMIALVNAKEVEPFRVEIKGPLDNPANTFGRGLFDEMLRRRAVDKIQEKLPDLLGDKTTNKLQELGILPQQKAPAATPDVAPAEAPQPQQQPKPQKPEDVLKDALGGFLSR